MRLSSETSVMRGLMLLFALLMLAACKPETGAPLPDIIKTQRDAMGKAKDVGNVLDKGEQEQREKMEKEAK
jgi:hypothetical protein